MRGIRNARFRRKRLNSATGKQLGLTSCADVIAHFTASSLEHDGETIYQDQKQLSAREAATP
jgi:hypothetical protein